MNAKATNNILHQTKDIYNAIAPDFSETRSKWWRGFDAFKKYANPGDRILDLGCGNGRMAEIFGDGVSYLGLDNSEELIKIARARFAGRKNIEFMVGDAIDFNQRGFDLVLLIAVLHHIPTRGLRLQVLQNINQSLNAGGRLVISSWNLFQPDYWRYLLNWPVKIKHGVFGWRDAFVPWRAKAEAPYPRYVHSFGRRELKKILEMAGFAVEEIYYERDGDRANFLLGKNLVAVARKI